VCTIYFSTFKEWDFKRQRVFRKSFHRWKQNKKVRKKEKLKTKTERMAIGMKKQTHLRQRAVEWETVSGYRLSAAQQRDNSET
jgi:hypothetical protein